MQHKKILFIVFAITIIHFVFSLAIGHYLGSQIASQMGQVVAGGVLDINKQKTEAETNDAYQKMKSNADELIGDWKITNCFLSLPIRFLLNPFFKKIQNVNLNDAINNKISHEQFYARWQIVHYTAYFINSFSLGLLVYFVLWLSRRIKT